MGSKYYEEYQTLVLKEEGQASVIRYLLFPLIKSSDRNSNLFANARSSRKKIGDVGAKRNKGWDGSRIANLKQAVRKHLLEEGNVAKRVSP